MVVSRAHVVFVGAALLIFLVVQVAIAGPSQSDPEAVASGSTKKQLKKLKRRVAALEERSVPTGAVGYFDLASCPAGWTEKPAARGRYFVGLPGSGSVGAVVGTPLTNLENRVVGRHSHAINDPGHAHQRSFMSGFDDINNMFTQSFDVSAIQVSNFALNTSTNTTGITVQDTGDVPGTNAPYMQLLVCQKS